jgi:hypothetical protein
MNAIVYVNTPLEAPEHAALAALAKKEGRAKGQQLRLLAIQAMRVKGGTAAALTAAGSDTARLRAHAAPNASAGRNISAAGSGDAPLPVPSPAPDRVRARVRTGSRARKGGRP